MKHSPALDAARGVMALAVTVCHVIVFSGGNPPTAIANIAVDGFFILSGYVLAGSYKGNFGLFLARRFVRLWPVYVFGLTIGYALHGMLPAWQELAWIPSVRMSHLDLTDKPAWTLYIEAWATPFLPLLVYIARANRAAGLLLAGVLMVVGMLQPGNSWLYVAFFAAGVSAAPFKIVLPDRVPAAAVWCGRIAYSLYLTNWLVLTAFDQALGRAGVPLAAAAILPVAWATWWLIERPSIALSRAIARGRSLGQSVDGPGHLVVAP